MSHASPTRMLLAGIVAVLAFFFQASSCFAERAGILPCPNLAVDQCCGDSSSSSSKSSIDAGCCHVVTTTVSVQPIEVALLFLSEEKFSLRPLGAPEAPVEEIDYPPQRLS